MSSEETTRPDPLPADLMPYLRVQVREASRPGRWMWEIVDIRDGALVERELEFESAGDARRAGLARLADLAPALPGAKMAPKSGGTPARRRIVVVARHDADLYDEFRRLFADVREIELIRDRRHGDRRRRGDRRVRGAASRAAPVVERRSHQRRRAERRTTPPDPNLQRRGWRVVISFEAHEATA
jgi:hypothetical protein